MRGKNGAVAEPVDEGDDDFEFELDASQRLEILWALIASSRQRQGKPAELTPEERSLTHEE